MGWMDTFRGSVEIWYRRTILAKDWEGLEGGVGKESSRTQSTNDGGEEEVRKSRNEISIGTIFLVFAHTGV